MANLTYRQSIQDAPASTTTKNATLTSQEIDGNFKSLNDELITKAPLVSPGFSGVPTAPTATAGTNTTQLATTAFVQTGLSGRQPLDATLTALSGVSTAANQLIYSTASDTFSTTGITSFGRSIIDDVDAPTARTTLGLGTAAVQSDDRYAHRSNNLSDLANMAVARSNLGLSNSATIAATTLNTGNTIVQRDASGNFSADTITASLSGNATTANALTTARTISLAGDVTGSVSFNGSANVSITATVVDDSHNHIISNVDGLQTALDMRVPLDSSTGAATIPSGSTAQRPTGTIGDFRFNTSLNRWEGYGQSGWELVGGSTSFGVVNRFSGTGVQSSFALSQNPGAESNTQVYINGIYQQKDTYSLSGTTITFSEAPPVGTDNIEVVSGVTLALGETDASLVTYNATTVDAQLDSISAAGGSSLVGFQQAGTGAVVRTAQDKLREFVTPYDFGAVGDGVADDTVAVQAFMSSGRSLNWLGGTYRITSQISVTASKDYLWSSSGACVVVDSSTPIESAIKIELAGFDAFLKGNIEINCQDNAYAGLLVLNNASVFATCELDGPIIRNVYRSGTTFNVGDGIYVFGAYSRVVIRNFEIRSVKMAVGAGVPFSYGVTGVTVQRFNNSARDAEFVLIEDFLIDRIYSEDVTYGARDQDGIRVQQAYQKSEAATYPNPVTAIVQNGKIKNAHGRAIKMVSEFGIVKNIQVARNVEIYSGFKLSASEDFDFQVSGGSLSGIRCYYNNNCPESVATFFIALVDGRRSPTAVSVDDVVVSSFVLAPTRLIDVDVGTAPVPAIAQINVSNVHISGDLLQLDEIVRLRNQNNIAVSALNYYVLLINVLSRVTRSFVWRESATIDNETAVTAIQCVKSNPTNVPLVTGALTTRILSSLVGQNYRLT